MSTRYVHSALADPAAIVSNGRARFTVLSDRLIRCEWDASGIFEDRPTLAAVHRRQPVPAFTVETSAGRLVVRTAALELIHQDDGKPFSSRNLSATFAVGKKKVQWKAGAKDRRNLGGTCRTLDGATGRFMAAWSADWTITGRTPLDLGQGFISPSGWAVFDDSASPLLSPLSDGREWAEARPAGERRDWYLFAHGLDYQGALADAAKVFGQLAMPPRYALGFWYCKYWAYTDGDVEELVAQHDRAGVPLDVVVIDMDWHQLGWTGYTWAPEYFPDHRETLAQLHSQGLKITLNLHPANGVSRSEEHFAAICTDLGKDPKRIDKIAFDCTAPDYMKAYFTYLHHPHEDAGVDFWWMDWQQGTTSAIAGLDPLSWLNHSHHADARQRRPDQRSLLLSRWGGVGAQRYPVGFTGDTHAIWASLAYQPYFTATAANVLFGSWSHDIGGHMPGPIEPELFLRWIQFGAFSPILRVHTTKTAQAERRISEYPEPWRQRMVKAVERRYELVPYLACEWRRGAPRGLSPCRPMYHHHPDLAAAYQAKDQYWFGEQMVVAPVVSQAADKDGLALVKRWLPPGDWIDTTKGRRVRGGWGSDRYTADEIPVFVRPGTIIAGQEACRRLPYGSFPHLLADVWAGGDGSYELLEDDGESLGYSRGEEARIPFGHAETNGLRTVTVGPAHGRFPGFLAKRSLLVRIHGAAPAQSVEIDGDKVPWSHRPTDGCWSWDGDTCCTVVRLPTMDLTHGITVTVRHRDDVRAKDLDGLPGRLRLLRAAATECMMATLWQPVYAGERFCAGLAQTGNRIARDPERAAIELAALRAGLRRLPDEITAYLAAFRCKLWRKSHTQIAQVKKAKAILGALV